MHVHCALLGTHLITKLTKILSVLILKIFEALL